MRQLASIRTVRDIQPIVGADIIVATQVDGWKCITKKGEFNVGDMGVYFEIDSFLPGSDERFAFLAKQFINFEGTIGARIRTIKLKGQLAQGLMLPLRLFPEIVDAQVGMDVTELLNVQKWEPYVPPQLAGEVNGNFPSFIKKTDEERCVSGDTLVETDVGFKTIKEVVETKFQGKVKSFNHGTNAVEFHNVIGWSAMPNEKEQWLKITTKSGKTIFVTKNHKIWNASTKSYQEASTLNNGEKVVLG
jgi:RNA ligase (TIGR02306 family)